MIDAIAEIFSGVITFIYAYVPNFGLTIIIMTIIVKAITFPLNNKQIQTTKRMQKLQPEMKKIQQQYKDDKQKQNQAVSEFMKENNMNPLAGCLPLLVQFPILIGIFRILREPDYFLNMEEINRFLFQRAEFIDLMAVPNVGFEDFISQISIYYIFPLIAGGTTFLYSKMSMPADSSQKMMVYLMPAMITVFSFGFPVGLVIYWTMNNIFSIGQHKLINFLDSRKEDNEMEIKSKIKDNKEEEQKKKTKEVKEVKKAKKEKKENEEDFFMVGQEKELEDHRKESGSNKSGTAGAQDGRTKKKKKGKGKK